MNFIRDLGSAASKKKAIFLVLTAIVIAATVYTLITPASTLDKENAKKQGGIDVEEHAQDVKTEESRASEGTIKAESRGYGISLSYGKKAGIPENAELTADEVKSGDDFDELMDAAEKASFLGPRFNDFGICFFDSAVFISKLHGLLLFLFVLPALNGRLGTTPNGRTTALL